MYTFITFFSTRFLYPLWSFIHKASLLLMGYSYVHHNETNLMRQLKKFYGERSITVFDVGLNIGSYSKEIYDIFSGTLEIYGFEPILWTYKLAEEKLRGYPNIHLYQCGLASAPGEATIYYNTVWEGTASIVPDRVMTEQEVIRLNTVDLFSQEEHIDRIDFMKIDVEWYEYFVLEGARNLLTEWKIDIIQFEFFRTNIQSKIFFRNFWDLLHEEYRLYRILNNSLVEIREYHPADCEIFLGMNYLAIRKNIEFRY